MNKKIKEIDELEEVDEMEDSDNSEEIKEIEESIEENEIKTPLLHKPMSFLGLIISIVLVPILIINIMFLVSIHRNQGKVPDLFGYMPLIILPDYMSPEIQSGDLIISKKIDIEDLQVGDIVSFYIPKGQGTGVATLRVSVIYEENGELLFGTQDATGDDFVLGVAGENIVGIWTGIRFPVLGRIIMFLQSTAGLLILIGLAVVFFIVYDIIRYKRYQKKQKDEVEELKAELEALRAQQAAGLTEETVSGVGAAATVGAVTSVGTATKSQTEKRPEREAVSEKPSQKVSRPDKAVTAAAVTTVTAVEHAEAKKSTVSETKVEAEDSFEAEPQLNEEAFAEGNSSLEPEIQPEPEIAPEAEMAAESGDTVGAEKQPETV